MLLYSPGKTGKINEPIAGRTRLVKMLFLFKHEVLSAFATGTEVNEQNFYQFFPWDFGPFSRDVYDDIAFFQLRGFIQSEPSEEESLPEAIAEWDKWRDETEIESDVNIFEEQAFTLSEKGVTFTAKMFARLTETQQELLRMFKAKLGSASLRGILRYVYREYRDQTVKSKIKHKVLA